MRKVQDVVRFPQSVQLFRFCFRILEIRRPDNKIHDQDLGEILDFNPSDTSHWKRGKKAIRSTKAIENLAKVLAVDVEILHDLADGAIDLDEAWCDFCDAEEERRLALEEPEVRMERRDKSIELEKLSQKILGKVGSNTVPVYVPELINAFPFIQLIPGDVSDKLARSSRIKPGHYAIRYRKGDVRAHTRIAICREIARIILLSERDKYNLSNRCETLSQAEIVEFANTLLIPREVLSVEVQRISTRANMVQVLADLFWVPKSAIRARLSSILLETAPDRVFETGYLSAKSEANRDVSSEENQEKFLDEEFSSGSNFSFVKKKNTPKPQGTSTSPIH